MPRDKLSMFLKMEQWQAHFLRALLFQEPLKATYNKGILEPPLYFCRDKDMNEIDLLIEDGGYLYPIKMKKHADPKKRDIDAFAMLD